MNEQDLSRFTELLRQSRSAVFFGGAGVSTESGVKDYRSADGLYNTVKEYGVPPETILSHSFFLQNTSVFYDFYYKYFLCESAQPNRAHKALAELERRGILSAVITQNIDGLHQAAGSKTVLELHGTASRHYCMKCGREYPLEELRDLHGGVPYCLCGGLVKPQVVLYEEALDNDVTSRAVAEIENADLLIIGGTSLAVYPAAAYIRSFRGQHVVLINRDATAYDDNAEIVFHESIGEVLSRAVAAL